MGKIGQHIAHGARQVSKILLPLAFIGTVLMVRSLAYAQAPLTQAPTAESLEEELKFLHEESVSIAARHEQPISEAPSNVYVITEEDIRTSGATDIPTILRRVPGMEVIQMTAAQFDVSVRGNNQPRANKLLVMIDGRSIYLDMQGEVRWKVIPISLVEIKRIEVLKGPASVLYGFNAFDGVINIITKRPEEMKGATLQVAGGELGTLLASGVYANTVNKFAYRLSGGHEQNQQWRNRDSLGFRMQRFNVDTEYTITPQTKLMLSGGVADADHYDGPVVENLAVTNETRHSYINGTYVAPNFFIRGFWNRADINSEILANPRIARFVSITDRDRNVDQLHVWDSYNIEAQHAVALGAWDRFTYGLNYRHNAISSNFLDQFSREDRFGVYVQNELNITRYLTAVTGVRYDLHTEIKPTVSPRVSLIFKPHANHSLRASVGVGYRPPTIFESHNDSRGILALPGLPSPLITVARGNTDLDPERIISYEIGYQGWYLKHRLRLRVDLFYNIISDLIVFDRPSPAVASPRFFNTGKGNIYGGEAGAEFLITRWLSGFANFAYQEIERQTFVGTAIRGAPRFKANGGLRADWDTGFSAEALVHYYGAATYPINSFFFTAANFPGGVPAPGLRVDSYVLLNVRGAYRFWLDRKARREVELAVSMFNAVDDEHKEHPLGDVIGSRVLGWVTIRY